MNPLLIFLAGFCFGFLVLFVVGYALLRALGSPIRFEAPNGSGYLRTGDEDYEQEHADAMNDLDAYLRNDGPERNGGRDA